MKRLLLLTAATLAFAAATPARADAQIRIRLGFPAVLPPLVEIQPGVRVVQDFDEEVFFVGGYYWVQRDDRWYRTRNHNGNWLIVEPGRVPGQLGHLERGHYRRFHHDERRAWPEQRHAPRNARHWKPEQYAERRGRGPHKEHEQHEQHEQHEHREDRH